MNRICHAIDCDKPVDHMNLMCPEHWVKVPTDMQVEIKTHFQSDQARGLTRPSLKWMKAARAAISYVHALEAKK